MGKLTLSIDDRIIDKAKKLAASQGTSVSDLFRQYIESRTKGEKRKVVIGPLIKKLTGIIPSASDEEYRDTIAAELAKKYKT
jgi:predicted CopG family antitoxin